MSLKKIIFLTVYNMNIIIFGKNGMLGNTLSLYLKNHFNVILFDRNDYNILN